MKHALGLALAAFAFATPAYAHDNEWWLVDGQPGADSLVFADSGSIAGDGTARTVRIATYSRQRSGTTQTVSVDCASETTALARFTCGDDSYRMRTAMLIGPESLESFARVVFAMKQGARSANVAAR